MINIFDEFEINPPKECRGRIIKKPKSDSSPMDLLAEDIVPFSLKDPAKMVLTCSGLNNPTEIGCEKRFWFRKNFEAAVETASRAAMDACLNCPFSKIKQETAD